MQDHSLFKIIYLAVLFMIALAGYLLDRISRRYSQNDKDDDGKASDRKAAASNVLFIVTLIGTIGLIFVLDGEIFDLYPELFSLTE